jgi:hypothetical protein
MLEPADVTRQFLETMIHIIGRKTSEEYAAVTIRSLLRRLQLTYPFIRDVEVKDTRFMEIENSVNVRESLNNIDPKKIGNALKDLTKKIMSSIGKTAGYFFIREVREKIGTDYNESLLRTMDVDLTLMQSTYIVEKKTVNLLFIEKSDVVRRLLKTLLDLVEKQTTKTSAIEFIAHRVDAARHQYPFLDAVRISDIRYTMGLDEVAVQQTINEIDSKELGKALQLILNETDTALLNQGRVSVVGDLQTHLTTEYLSKLEEFGVNITAHGLGYDMLLKQTITTIVDLLTKACSEAYAIYVVNNFLQKTDHPTGALHVNILSMNKPTGIYQISITNDVDSISETDVRRAIQKLLSDIVRTLGEKSGDEFIQTFKNSLEKKYLSRIEELGVNLHMIELHQELSAQVG